MHFVIINCSPHNKNSSNTAMLLDFFQKGIMNSGSTYERYNLVMRSQWFDIKMAIISNENIIFALPVYAATVPGLMKEFLEELFKTSNNVCGKKISFILQSGFPEACQRIYCENYLKGLPALFESSFNGILSYGINCRFIENIELKDVQDSFCRIGEKFAENNGNFFFKEVEDFNGNYYITEKEAQKFNRIFAFFCKHISEEMGCNESLTKKPYQDIRD